MKTIVAPVVRYRTVCRFPRLYCRWGISRTCLGALQTDFARARRADPAV